MNNTGGKKVQLISRFVLGATLLAQAGTESKGIDVYAIAKDFGVPAAIVLFVLTEGRQRETRFEKRIAENERFARNQLVTLFERSNEEIRRNTKVFGQLCSILNRHGVSIPQEDSAIAPPRGTKRKTSDFSMPVIDDNGSES